MTGRFVPMLTTVLAGLLVAGCGMLPIPFSTPAAVPVRGGAGPIREAKDVWQANGIDSYTWRFESACECALNGPIDVTVVDGVATKVVTPGGVIPLADVAGFPLTVDAMWDAAIEAADSGGKVDLEWGPIAGVPARILIDRVPAAIDDELSLRVVRLDPAP